MTQRTFFGAAPLWLVQDEKPRPLLPQLFPAPTGQNGYEDLMQAADLLRGNAAFSAAEGDSKRLLALRKALADPPVVQARALVRRALGKPMTSPRAGQPLGLQTALPDLAGLRTIARLKNMETRLFFADGRSVEAIRTAFETCRLCEGIRGETLIGGLVEVACRAIAVASLFRHADLWSVPDCQRVLQAARHELLQPDFGLAALEGEQRFFQKGLDDTLKGLADPKALQEMTGEEEIGEEGERLAAEFRQRVQDPAGREAIKTHLRQRQEELMESIRRYLEDPSADPPAPPTFGESTEERLAGLLTPALHQSADRFLQIRIQFQLLAVHAAIRRWRWENDALPGALTELRLEPALVTDPFTRQSLIYERTNETAYQLASAGPLGRSPDGKPDRTRQPIALKR